MNLGLPKIAHNDTIDPADRIIARLYRSGLSVAADDFRRWALRQLQTLVPFDAALWGSGGVTRWKFHTVTVTDLPPEFPQILESTTRINPIIPRILQNLDTPVGLAKKSPCSRFCALANVAPTSVNARVSPRRWSMRKR